jgi:hypothetical protein
LGVMGYLNKDDYSLAWEKVFVNGESVLNSYTKTPIDSTVLNSKLGKRNKLKSSYIRATCLV